MKCWKPTMRKAIPLSLTVQTFCPAVLTIPDSEILFCISTIFPVLWLSPRTGSPNFRCPTGFLKTVPFLPFPGQLLSFRSISSRQADLKMLTGRCFLFWKKNRNWKSISLFFRKSMTHFLFLPGQEIGKTGTQAFQGFLLNG